MNIEFDRRLLLSAAGLAGVAALSRSASAGPLNPPAGPITSTTKPLSDVEPRIAVNATNIPGDASNVFIITQPGSYYFTADLAIPPGKNGVFINADNVVLDLDGWAITGPAVGSTIGVLSQGANSAVRNGTIRSVDKGIRAANAVCTSDVAVSAYTNMAIDANGPALIERCSINSAALPSAIPINLGPVCIVNNSVIQGYSAIGIQTTGALQVQGCLFASGGSGVGAPAAAGVAVLDCNFVNLALGGVLAGNGAAVHRCTFRTIGQANGTAYFGVSVGNGSTVADCTFHDIISTSVGGAAINASGETNVSNCSIASNSGGAAIKGIIVSGGCVRNCAVVVAGNSCVGITANNGASAIGNRVVAGGAGSIGIQVGTGCTVDGNHIGAAVIGINLAGNAGNIVVRNFIHSATTAVNSTLPANNIIGPTVAAAAAAAAAASTNPHSNYAL